MEFINLICPNSPSVWNGNGISECFDDMMLGFGPNLITLLLIAVVAFSRRNATLSRITGLQLSEKIFWHLLPSLGACLSLCNVVLLLIRAFHGHYVAYHQWLFRCSQTLVWAIVMVFWRWDLRILVFFNQVICFWWIVRPILMIPHIFAVFTSAEVLTCLKESCSTLVDVAFGIFLNFGQVRQISIKRKYGMLEDPLLAREPDIEDCYHREFDGNAYGGALSYWNLLTFKSISLVMDCGATKQLDFDDLVPLPVELSPSSCHDILLSCWVVEQNKNYSHPSLFRAICYAYGWPYLCLGLLKVVNDCIGFAAPLLLNKLIWFLQKGSGHFDGYILAISLGLTSIIKSFLDTQYTFHLSKLKLKLRSSIMTVIYRKCICVSLAQRSKFSEGEIQTFMSIDADRTVNLCNSFHDMWSLPLQIGVVLYLLYTQVKFAFVSGMTITILLIPVNKWLSTLIANATEKMMKQKDERIRRTGELLTYIRTLKMYSWELLFADHLRETRSREVDHLSTRKYLDAWCVFFWATTPTLFSLFTFGLFTLTGHALNAATVFTCLALFNSLISPLNSFPWVINGLIDAIISTRRLSIFLSCSEHISESTETSNESPPFFYKGLDDSSQPMAVIVRNACCVWSSSNEEQNSVLNHVTLDLPKGSLIAVIGEVGSGKSSLLNSVLGEMRLIQGSIHSYGSIAYVSQVSWILSGTIRDNILLGKGYDVKRYTEVLRACALDVDISRMAGGDLAYIGEKGVNLSGGQKARLALARAIYYGADLFMLDDVLSAVDAQVASWILKNAILGPLMTQDTRIICTHNLQAISSADMIVVMDKGHVKWTGCLAEFSDSPYSVIPSLRESIMSSSEASVVECSNKASDDGTDNLFKEKGSMYISEEAQVIETESRKEGRVELSIYK